MEPFFQVEQLRRSGNFNMDTDHFHDSYEIYYLLSGERHYYIHNRIYALQAGDLVFINKNQLHRTTSRNRSRHERILVNFDDLFLKPAADIVPDLAEMFQGESFLLRPNAHEQGGLRICSRRCCRSSGRKRCGAGRICRRCCFNC
ncbi:AraC family ligand binding domain-containing protein [Paenibacillus sonchi]|uniref:AraC family ligand binding domain-containing protein n=1 Tax=Paenibacillus sonchi TaxID=373687 RepID=UPI002D807ED4|nr:AraC family ligand binding domain-containing protein [Paenibacillus sonchi]